MGIEDKDVLAGVYYYSLCVNDVEITREAYTVFMKKALERKWGVEAVLFPPKVFLSKQHFEEAYQNWREINASVFSGDYEVNVFETMTNVYSFLISQINLKEYQVSKSNFVRKLLPNVNPKRVKKSGKIQIAFASSYFIGNVIGVLFLELIKRIPRDCFNVQVFQLSSRHQGVVSEFQEHADLYLDLGPMSMNEQKNEIEKHAPDIIIYPDMGICKQSLFLAHFRIAPVQCTTWGLPVTSGISTIDYFISSRMIEVHNAQEHYSEKLILLNKLPCYIECAPKVQKLETAEHIYSCFHCPWKLHPDMDQILYSILKKDPRAVIIFEDFVKEGFTEHVNLLKYRLTKALGDLMSRVRFLKQVPFPDYLKLLSQCHVVLDPIYYGCGARGYDSFSQDVPIVTCPTEMMRGRIVNGMYQQMSVEGCVAKNVDQYVEIALRCGNDPVFRKEMSDKISQNKHKLFSDEEFVQEFAQVMKSLVEAKQ